MLNPDRTRIFTALLAVPLLLGAAAPVIFAAPAHAETAVAPEVNPPGDIPDSQVFIDYTGGRYSLKVPEGWARSGDASAVTFADKLDGVSVKLSPMAGAPTKTWASKAYATTLKDEGRAVKDIAVTTQHRKAGDVIRVSYTLNSEPNPVTSKQMRLEAQRYLFWKNGTLATLTLWAPAGADNVDQWQLMSESFRWK